MPTKPYPNAQGQWIIDLPDGSRLPFATEAEALLAYKELLMEQIYTDYIRRAAAQARLLRNSMATTQEIDTLQNGVSDYAHKITQAMLDSEPEFLAAGLTTTQVADAVYVLKMANTALEGNLPSLIVVANLQQATNALP